MTIRDISPFVRNAVAINFRPMQEYGIAGDCHFFLMETPCTAHIDGKSFCVGLDSVVIVPAGVQYYFESGEPVRMIALNYDYTESASDILDPRPPRLAKTFDESRITERPDFKDHEILNKPIVMENMFGLRGEVEAILREFEFKRPFYREMAAAKFKNVIFGILRETVSGGKANAIVTSALEYIHKHYSEDIDNESIAHHVGYHSYYLNRLVKAVTGTTLRKYIINYRIEIAKRYLEENDLSVSAVAELCGYKNLCNFSFDFKKKTGLSPSQYRDTTDSQHQPKSNPPKVAKNRAIP